MGKLIIKRRSEWINKMRNIELHLDGKQIGKIADGEVKIFDLAPGSYSLRAKIDWCSSQVQNVTIGDEGSQTIELCAYKKNGYIFAAIVIFGVFVLISPFYNVNYPVLIMCTLLPSLLFLIYYLTFGRKEYLQLIPMENKNTLKPFSGALRQ